MGFFDWARRAWAAPAKRDNYAATYGGSGAGFAGGSIGRLTASMAQWSGSVNLDLDGSLTIMRARGRALAQNNEYGKRFCNLCATNIVGPAGPKLQVRALQAQRDPNKPTTLDKAANDAVEIHWQKWGRQADITGKLSFAHLLRLAVKSVARDGECLVRIVRQRGLPYGIALQLLEADRLDETLNIQDGTRTVRQGVELDSFPAPGRLLHQDPPPRRPLHGRRRPADRARARRAGAPPLPARACRAGARLYLVPCHFAARLAARRLQRVGRHRRAHRRQQSRCAGAHRRRPRRHRQPGRRHRRAGLANERRGRRTVRAAARLQAQLVGPRISPRQFRVIPESLPARTRCRHGCCCAQPDRRHDRGQLFVRPHRRAERA
jgi:hypothetical protein